MSGATNQASNLASNEAIHGALTEASCDPGFVLEGERGLRLSAQARARVAAPEAWRWLAMRVARRPFDLRAHAQRIRLLSECQESGLLFGALVDLYLVLGEQGQGLRQALLEEARAALDPDDHAYLQAQLAGGLDRGALLPMATGAVMARGAMGTGEVVTAQAQARARGAAEDAHDPYDDPYYVPRDAQP